LKIKFMITSDKKWSVTSKETLNETKTKKLCFEKSSIT